MDPATMYLTIQAYLERLPGAVEDGRCIYTPHSLCATTATLLLDAGVDITKVQELLGHRHPDLRQTPAHHLGERLARRADLRQNTSLGRKKDMQKLLLKLEFPSLYATASTAIAIPLLLATTVSYVQRAITQPAAELYPLGIAVFGVTVALSSVCFTMASVAGKDSSATHAGETFLHSSLLLIQSLIIVYTKEAILASQWIHQHNTAIGVISVVASTLISLLSTAAVWTWYWGLRDLNSDLWRKAWWRNRVFRVPGKSA